MGSPRGGARSADPKLCAIEFRLQWRGGEVRWVEVHWLAYFEGALRERGAASVVGTVADITERKEMEHLLMREINHRTKNMLSGVHTIANQTGAKNLEDFVQNFSKRIQALAANQDLLIRDTNGMEWSSRIWFMPRSRLSPTSLVFVSPRAAPCCA